MYYMNVESGEIKTMKEWEKYITNELIKVFNSEEELHSGFNNVDDFIKNKKDTDDFYPPLVICKEDGTDINL